MLCQQARAIVEQVDWPCEVTRHYSDNNLGCRARVSSGLDFVFSKVDEAIILEDDCVPEPTFFRYCEELLQRYRDDERVMTVSGNNFQSDRQQIAGSYYFSRYPHVWGWATWRRAWQHYDVAMKEWPQLRDQQWLESFLSGDRSAVRFWSDAFQAVYARQIDTWDYQWTFACWKRGALTALPRVNLISNIGFGAEATHTRRASRFSKMPVQPLDFPLNHPSEILRHTAADAYTQKQNFRTGLRWRTRRLLRQLLPKLA